jgi:hypothetical protein
MIASAVWIHVDALLRSTSLMDRMTVGGIVCASTRLRPHGRRLRSVIGKSPASVESSARKLEMFWRREAC